MKSKPVKIAGYVLTAASLVFLAYAVVKLFREHPDFSKVRHPLAAVGIGLLIAAGFAAAVYLSAFAWKMVLEYLHGGRLRYREIASVYVRSNVGKYLPGNVMQFAGRNLLAAKLGLSQFDITFSTLTEIALLLFTTVLLSAALAYREFARYAAMAFLSAKTHPVLFYTVSAAAAAVLAAFIALVARGGKFEKYRKFFRPAFFLLALRLIGIYAVTLLLPGFYLAALLSFVFGCPIPPALLMTTVGLYTVSWVVGYALPGVSGGIGVREAVLLLLLGPLYPQGVVLVAAILHRLLSILGDAAAFGAEPFFCRGARGKRKKE